ncbi:MAG TPA: pilus assembly protein TadG-related protein [Candidatus Eisenbacteria bacterium]|nr:pilus assembly protein TadG-related protein [Candidatus Eisenbacteria bacterium]
MRRSQSGQVMVLVAVSLLALIGSAALVLLAGSVEWQRNQLQQLADQAALDSALKIGVGCDLAKATAVITEADTFLGTQRTRIGTVPITPINGASCTAPYTATRSFAGGLSATYNYPYQSHQQQVEVILTLTLPIAFGGEVGKTTTSVTRRAVAQQLAGSVPAIRATTLTCGSGQVNAGGSVFTQSLIARGGTCALYAHSRFDAASATYSDLGNMNVYTDGQSWTAPGTCSAGSNSGSSSAICADGYELSGRITPACGGATSYLLAGDKAINPNPCAAGTGPQPAPPVSTNLPPEPNLDPVAVGTLQGTGGAACSAGAMYPNIVVGGSTVATGLGPVPAIDPSGFYHFKPSCYGYLNPSLLTGGGGGISNRQTGPEAGPSSTTVTATLPSNSQAGTLLVATLRSTTSPSKKPFTAPAGWVSAVPGGAFLSDTAHTEIWYYPNNPGGIASADFGVNPTSLSAFAQMSEWSGVVTASPLDQTGTLTVSSPVTNPTISTGGATSVANELVITNNGFVDLGGGNPYTPGAGWNSLNNDPGNGFSSDYRLDLPAGVASETPNYASATTWAMVIATFKPAGGGGGGSGAVLDPGFYYFNGWSGTDFTSGGGICLNGATLLARDVTLEFVNQAGFSSGTCAVGGGTLCSAPCQFGSPPCSLSPCPPNAGADSPNNLTWFAAPCSSAPAGDAASCLGPLSTWCLPAGDRSCTNVLIWAPASNVGQIAIKGAAAKHWLLGSVYWPGTCTDTVNGTSTIAGSVFCGNLTISAAAGAAIAIGGDYGIGTALVEAVLVE